MATMETNDTRATPDRNLALELVRVTESAALAASQWVGRGDKLAADGAAVAAMRYTLGRLEMHGVVVIGEGEKDEAPMLYVGEEVGNGRPPEVDIAVDPIDGTRLTALGMPNAIAVVALAERGAFYSAPPGLYYMEKIAVGPEAANAIDITKSVAENLAAVAAAKGMRVTDLTAIVLDRPRHEQIIHEIREVGARIKFIADGDVAGAIQAARGNGGDILLGIGGAPEAVIAAAALRCFGGAMQCRLWARTKEEHDTAVANGVDMARVLHLEDLARGDDLFFTATGITDGELLEGVRFTGQQAHTQSLVMRSRSGTIRKIESTHRVDRIRQFVQPERS